MSYLQFCCLRLRGSDLFLESIMGILNITALQDTKIPSPNCYSGQPFMVRLREVNGQNLSLFLALHVQSLYSTHITYEYVLLQPSGFSIVCCWQLQLWGMTGESCTTANSPAVLFAHLDLLLCYLWSRVGELSISHSVCALCLASLHRDFTMCRRIWTGALVILGVEDSRG